MVSQARRVASRRTLRCRTGLPSRDRIRPRPGSSPWAHGGGACGALGGSYGPRVGLNMGLKPWVNQGLSHRSMAKQWDLQWDKQWLNPVVHHEMQMGLTMGEPMVVC